MVENEHRNHDLPAGFNWLRDQLSAGSTGILHLEAPALTDRRVYLMNGQILACASDADDWMFGRLLLASGAIGASDLERAMADVGDGDLAEALMRAELLSMDSLQGLQSECFRDNMVDACVLDWSRHHFESMDAVFPPNMQLGVDTDALLAEIERWHDRVFPLLQILRRRQDPVFQVSADGRPPGGEASLVLGAIQDSGPLTSILALSPLAPFRTLAGLIDLLSAGAISISVDESSSAELASMTQELEALPMPREGSDDMPSPISVSLEPMRADDVGLGEGPDVLTPAQAAMLGDDEPLAPPQLEEGSVDDLLAEDDAEAAPDASPAPAGEIDYDAVEAGEHARVYDVLDKVDLSHVDSFPTPEGGQPASPVVEGIDEVIEAAADHSIELGEDSEMSEIGTSAPAADGDLDGAVDDAAPPDSGEAAEAEAPPIHLTGTEDSIEFFIDIDDDEGRESSGHLESGEVPPANAEEVEEQYADLPYDRGEIASFIHRIEVFNRIFSVINETFRAPLGDEETVARFNRFLRDDSLQYPDLFVDIDVESDGTIAPAPLLRNLAAAGPDDPESYLHQGLYELIYVHLYDAKDVLTPEQEQAMMDEISAVEEDLHD